MWNVITLQFKEKTITSLIQTGEGFSLNLMEYAYSNTGVRSLALPLQYSLADVSSLNFRTCSNYSRFDPVALILILPSII